MIDLNSTCSQLFGVGPAITSKLEKLGIKTVQDLLFHLPYRYEDRTKVVPINQLTVGVHALVVGAIQSTKIIQGRKTSFLCKLKDATGIVWLRFFHFHPQQIKIFSKVGLRLSCYGEVSFGAYGLELMHPECRILKANTIPVENHLTAVYPTTAGLSQTVLRKLITQSLAILERKKETAELLPQEILQQFNLSHFAEALHKVHCPPKNILPEIVAAREYPFRQRLIFEELLAHQLSFLKLRQQVKTQAAVPLIPKPEIIAKFITQLSFNLTAAQNKVIAEITADLAKNQPMLRLLQGDVGCGKTIVAAVAILQAVSAGFQAAIMAPTELLAEQHYQNIKKWLENFGIKIVLLTGKIKGKTRKIMLQEIAGNSRSFVGVTPSVCPLMPAQIIIGTHALFQEEVKFANLALVIIDEQHRFGVEQRLALWKKGENNSVYPHQLIMTATPIPRTLAMTMYADLDISVIDEVPRGRNVINTVIVSDQRRHEIIAKVKNYCKNNQQVYWVCPLIEESETLQCKAAETIAKELAEILKEFKIGLIHGRMKAQQKDLIMQSFQRGEINILVATTVIEVGIDVKNANLIIIENSEKLGLVQLHQLRGRVGRGNENGYCVLIYQNKLSNKSEQRLIILRDNFDGFFIANKDLELRGAGELLGIQQTGLQKLRIADLICDVQLLSQVRCAAIMLFQQHILAVIHLIRRWSGDSVKYGVV